jgi:nucleoside-diphosphate-sugar epimerase
MQLHTNARVLVTGASGFIGTALLARLMAEPVQVYAAVRRNPTVQCPAFEVGDINDDTDWSSALRGIDTVVHLAAYAHVTSRRKLDHGLLKKTNVEGATNLARQSAQAGVRHFVFLSSIGAMADSSDHALTFASPCRPTTAYGASKLEAENAIRAEFKECGTEWTILRAPLVYGPRNPGNMHRLLKLVHSGVPLPLASVRNRRSFIYVENLVDLITACLGNSKAFGKTFLASDGEDVSTPELIEKISRAEIRNARFGFDNGGQAVTCVRLFAFPDSLLKSIAQMPGLSALRKLISSLYVDTGLTQRELGWRPPFSMEEGLRRTLSGGMRG